MEKQKPKYKFSMLTVVIIFVLLYLAELGLGAGIFFNFVLPKIESYKISKIPVSQNIISEQTSVYSLILDKKFDDASKSAQLMLTHSKTQTEKALSLQMIGEVLVYQNKYQQAKISLQEAVKLENGLPEAYIYLANVNLYEKDYSSAILNSQKAIGLAPKRTDFFYILGLAYFGAGDKQKALTNIQKAVDAYPNVAFYKQNLDGIKNGTFVLYNQNNPQAGNSTVQQAPPAPDLGYTADQMKIWQDQLSYIDQDLKNIPNFLGNNSYDQGKLNQMLSLLNQRKAIAGNLYNKMINKQPLSAADGQSILTYGDIVTQYDSLSKQVFPH